MVPLFFPVSLQGKDIPLIPSPSPARGEGCKGPAGPVLISYPGAERWRSRYAGDTRIRAIAGATPPCHAFCLLKMIPT